jgi:hypothetical protein
MVRIRPGDRDKYPPRAPSKPWGGNPIFDKNDFSGGNFFEAGLEAAELSYWVIERTAAYQRTSVPVGRVSEYQGIRKEHQNFFIADLLRY